MAENRIYVAIDLKSFYASVECVERNLDPLDANLVVADPSRTEKTICLAVSPSLKAYGIPGRARLFEAVQKIKEINNIRKSKAPGHRFSGVSYLASELSTNPSLELDCVIAPPQMAKYMDISTKIFSIYMKYISAEDIHVYSIDEVFMDVTDYLKTYNMTARELTIMMIRDVLSQTGITATAGIGTNMYLCKIAMDIEAKHIPPDKDGVRIAELDEMSYRRNLWDHRPLTDFWRIGRGYSAKLENLGLYTMGDIARFSLTNSELLYKTFGINAELLIDHAWGWEPTGISDIKNYHTENNSLSSGQVLPRPYSYESASLVVREMADNLALDLVEKRLVTDQIVLTVCYDSSAAKNYTGELDTDHYGRIVPKDAHGSFNLGKQTSSSALIIKAAETLYEKNVNSKLPVRRIYIVANHVLPEKSVNNEPQYEQINFFTNYEENDKKFEEEKNALNKERKMQEAIISIKNRFGKNSILKGMDYESDATARERNSQVGGHKA